MDNFCPSPKARIAILSSLLLGMCLLPAAARGLLEGELQAAPAPIEEEIPLLPMEPEVLPDVIARAEDLMQNGRHEEANRVLREGPIPAGQEGYASWLSALSLYRIPDRDKALEACLASMKAGADASADANPWIRKIRFLAAEIYVDKRDYLHAEEIFASEAARLLSESRKEEIASEYIRFAQSLAYQPKPEELDLPQPDFAKAYVFYKKALELEIGPVLREDVRFQMARMKERSRLHREAADEYLKYLAEFDPEWTAPTGASGTAPGKNRMEARYRLAECWMSLGDPTRARTVFEDLASLAGKAGAAGAVWSRLAMRRLPFTYGFPSPRTAGDLEAGLRATESFLERHPGDSIAVTIAWNAVAALSYRGRTDDAVAAAGEFLARKRFSLTVQESAEEAALREGLGIKDGPAAQWEGLQMKAQYLLGQLYYAQARYAEAARAYAAYAAQFPHGPDWTNAQKGIVDAEYQVGAELLRARKYDEANASWEAFLAAHPLDARARQILFSMAWEEYQLGAGSRDAGKAAEAADRFRRAVAGFRKLVSKYPRTEESGLAQLRIGEVLENELGDLPGALDAYRTLTWSSYSSSARERAARMTAKELTVRTERIYRTDEPAVVSIMARNVKAMSVAVYKLDLKEYFRKFHSIRGVEDLDLPLIAPDRTWNVPVTGFRDFLPIAQAVPIPMDGPGVYAVTISEETLEATTLVIRSDIDIVFKSSRAEVLVFAENMRTGAPATGAEVLITDGTRILAEGRTNADGVLHVKPEGMDTGGDLGVFASLDGNVAASGLESGALAFARGLAPKGYLYTDRPVYRPGETVHFRGILRDVEGGEYKAPAGKTWQCSVVDARGSVILSRDVVLSAFGTFEEAVDLGSQAGRGRYSIRVLEKATNRTYSGAFQVEEFQVDKVKLSLEFDKPYYFRGEKVRGTFTAVYYYGSPAAGKEVRYTLPDGRELTGSTDASGRISFEIDTAAFQAGARLSFGGRIVEENVSVSGQAAVVGQAFFLTVAPARPVSLTGEPVEVTILARDFTGNPVSDSMELTVLKREIRKPDPLLSGIPWMGEPAEATWAERTLGVFPISTDKAGTARFTYKPETDGVLVYRVKGRDRLGNVVSGEAFSSVSGDSDEVRLRLFADTEHYRVGETAEVRIHSRLAGPRLALITFEGEGIISYAVRTVDKGYTPLRFDVDHPHFPNFHLNVALMNGNRLETAGLPFTVERELRIRILPEKDVLLPGETAVIAVEARDHLGKPVESEFSLSLVNEAVFAKYPDPTEDIVAFFQKDALRQAVMRLGTSCTFAYAPRTVEVDQAIVEEEGRLAAMAEFDEEYAKGEGTAAPAMEKKAESPASKADASRSKESVRQLSAGAPAGTAGKDGAEAARRLDAELEGIWLVSVTTGKDGTSRLSLPLPEAVGAYRATVKACTAETLVGESRATLTVRKDFFVDLRVPPVFQEGDTVSLTGSVHNQGTYAGALKAVLTFTSDSGEKTFPLEASVEAGGITQLQFPGYKVPRGETVRVRLDAAAGQGPKDGVTASVPVAPWGLSMTESKSGIAASDRTVMIRLPKEGSYESRTLSVVVGSSVSRRLVDLVLHRGRSDGLLADPVSAFFPAQEPSDLLALASLLSHLEGREAMAADLEETRGRTRAAVSGLTASQRTDGSWRFGSGGSEVEVSALSYWALAAASRLGIGVDARTMKKGEEFLKSRYAGLGQDDYDMRAMILHALTQTGGADYTFVNRLYRERGSLGEAALAYTALSLAALDRADMGREVLRMLEKKDTVPWSGEKNAVWERNPVETTALALLAYEALDPASERTERAARYLLESAGWYGCRPAKALGVVAAALTGYYRDVQEARADYALEIAVNGTPIGTLSSKGGTERAELPVPPELVKDGENGVSFRMTGRGEYLYAVTLTGFTVDFDRAPAWKKPSLLSKTFIHEDLTYKGRAIAASTMAVTELESGGTATVRIRLSGSTGDRYIALEDRLPAGATLLQNSFTGGYSSVRTENRTVTFYFEPWKDLSDVTYRIAGFVPGAYAVLPPVLRNVLEPSETSIGKPAALSLLAPGVRSTEAYLMNDGELLGFGKAYFDDGQEGPALEVLERLYARSPNYGKRDVARMLLWIRSDPAFYDAARLVEYFEVLKESAPDLSIPFDRILAVGRAYHEMGEHERALLVYRATVEASFYRDAPLGGTLEQAGEFMGSVDYMKRLWSEYPDSAPVVDAYFALAQKLYQEAPKAASIKSRLSSGQASRPTGEQLYREADAMLWRFLSVYGGNPLADDAAFSRVNLQLDRGTWPLAVHLSRQYRDRFPKSGFSSDFRYMEALGLFSLRRYEDALEAARTVSEGDSEDRDLATYILGQIYHTMRDPSSAVQYYNRVKDVFPDAREAAANFERKGISMDEVITVRPGEPVLMPVRFRNINEGLIQVYRVDLMKLYLKEKNLSRIAGINLSGIAPQIEMRVQLGTDRDYRDGRKTVPLSLEQEGAYLVIIRGDDLFTSGLVLVTPLALEVQEDAVSGRVRVNVKEARSGRYAGDVHVKVIGSGNEEFVSGQTDLRGIFVADGIQGAATVIARDRQDRYAFYRGTAVLAGEREYRQQAEPEQPEADYRGSTRRRQDEMQQMNKENLDKLYEENREGVQVQEAY